MTTRLLRLVVQGPGKPDTLVTFNPAHCLIRGPSDTGKSYIFQCIAYCLGSDTSPDEIPEAGGYDTVALEIENRQGVVCTIVRGLSGGSAAIFESALEAREQDRKLAIDLNEFGKRLAGVENRLIVRKAGVKGPVTAGSLRHWSLLSETDIVAKSSVLGDTNTHAERGATLSLLLTGQDDAAIEVGLSLDERREASGGYHAVDEMLSRVKAELPVGVQIADIEDSLRKVDAALAATTEQHKSRAAQLRQVRHEIAAASDKMRTCEAHLAQSSGMVNRFQLLEKKYRSDLDRLVALNEGIAVFELLKRVPCPLCGTPIEQQIDKELLTTRAPKQQRQAFAAEANKIDNLRKGLLSALEHERQAVAKLQDERNKLLSELQDLERLEKSKIETGVAEFTVSPTDLAIRRSELFAQLRSFQEMEQLVGEAQRLKERSATKGARIQRPLTSDGLALSKRVLALLHAWGFANISSVEFDASRFDLTVNGRRRTTYGKGTRAVFLTAYYIALLEHCLSAGRPHVGIVVVDSPLKAYADPKPDVKPDVPLETVRSKFYDWLSKWTGPGQVVILENEEPPQSLSEILKAIEFTGYPSFGRPGFYVEGPSLPLLPPPEDFPNV
jgi:hypothetical protein